MPRYRLGIDIGSKSLGWAAIRLDEHGRPCGLLDIGVRIFPDGREPAAEGRTGTSLAAARRLARGARRNRDRFLRRRGDLMDALIRHGLMPEDEAARKALETLDPYELRAKGLDEALPAHHLGRALFHLHQRRGFRSNRRTERGDKESGKIKEAARELECAIEAEGCRTLGEYLSRLHARREGVRARLRGEGAKAAYDLYPTRQMVEHEFETLWDRQIALGAQADAPEARADIHDAIFRQRPLRPVEPGKCTFDPPEAKDDLDGYRAPRALPLFQEFRIHQDLGNLQIVDAQLEGRRLRPDERHRLAADLLRGKDLTFKQIRQKLGFPPDVTFNLESGRLDKLEGSRTAYVLSRPNRFGKAWFEIRDRWEEIVERLLKDEDEGVLLNWLEAEFGLDPAAARAVAAAPLPDTHGRLGRRALRKLLPKMRDGNMRYFEAVAAIPEYGHHSDFRTGEVSDRLPYYGVVLERYLNGSGDPADRDETRFGRFPNPTVHIGLNQFRRAVNTVIAKHGAPERTTVELARDLKLSSRRKEEISREQDDNRRRNDVRRKKLEELDQTVNGGNLLRLRLWEELNPDNALDRRCPYSGEPIGCRELFSNAVDVDHILPFSRTWDDSPANKIVCKAFANRTKGEQSPYEAFGGSPNPGYRYAWDEIAERAKRLPDNKSWRFKPDAMEEFEQTGGFDARQLTDTAYLSRLTREYAARVCPDVGVVPGRLTALMRRRWGLDWILSDHNLKNRYDHRHHAIDACVAALTDAGLLQRISRANATESELVEIPLPEAWPDLRDELKAALAETVVSYRLDHGTGGRLHEETAYGLVGDPEKEHGNLVYRRPLSGLGENEIARIRDPALRAELQAHVDAKLEGRTVDRKERLRIVKEALAEFGAEKRKGRPGGVRRIRLLKRERNVLPIANGAGAYKAYIPGENHHIGIFEDASGRWRGQAVTVFAANQHQSIAAPVDGRLIMRLHKGDMLKLEHDGAERIMRVVQLEAENNRIRLAEHHEGGELQKRHADPDDPFRWLFASFNRLKEMRARLVRVDEAGRVHDPGTPA